LGTEIENRNQLMIVRNVCKEGKVGLLAKNLEKIGKVSKYPHKRKRGDFDKQ